MGEGGDVVVMWWCGVVWCGVVWCGVVVCGCCEVVRCEVCVVVWRFRVKGVWRCDVWRCC